MLDKTARDWLAARNLDAGLAERMGLRSERPDGGRGSWIAAPYRRNGEEVNCKYRSLEGKDHRQKKDGVQCVWNEDCLRESEFGGPVIITEGEWDALAALQCGYERVVSVPAGAPAEAMGDAETARYAYIPDLLTLLRDEREIIIASDGDNAGSALLSDLSVRLGKSRCKFLTYPKAKDPAARGRERLKDLNEVLDEYGERGVKATVDNAAFVYVEGVWRISQMPPPAPLMPYRISFSDDFKKHVAICKGHLSVWTGIPGHGKSALVKAVSVELAMTHDWRHAFAVFEEEPSRDFRRDIAKYLGRMPYHALDAAQWKAADDFLERHYVFMRPSLSDDVTLEWMLDKMEIAVIRENVSMCVIDPWNEMDHERGDMSETDYTAHAIKRLKRFAQRMNVHVAVIAHPAKNFGDTRDPNRIPGGYDISGSAHWRNKPELGVTAHRDETSGVDVTLVRVWKSKLFDLMGPTGDVRLRHNFRTGRYAPFVANEESA